MILCGGGNILGMPNKKYLKLTYSVFHFGISFTFSDSRVGHTILYYDRNGFCLWQKRLEKHRFKWPTRDQDVLEIRRHELSWLLDGLDISQAHERLKYEVVS